MAKVLSKYVCQNCAYESTRWLGRCPGCGEWNTFSEEIAQKVKARKGQPSTSSRAMPLDDVESIGERRLETGMSEFDRVLGGGIVGGSIVLIGGDPGVGKSTLMMQLAARINTAVVLYVSGEESPQQIKIRADRLRLGPHPNLLVLAETDLDIIKEVIARTPPDVIIVDSIQTMFRSELESSPGSVGQVRESTALLTRIAKGMSIPCFLIGHVTKEGVIAGPKVIEHMVDTVLQFEGERQYAYRILRAIKNRFGSTNEIGVFEMRDSGLVEVKNPSEMFLSHRTSGASGSSVVATVEGTRPILVEAQALVSPSTYGTPQRNASGFDLRRLALLVAVLEKRAGVLLGHQDVFINIAGGVQVDEPAVDLGIVASMVSSLRDSAVPGDIVAVGEIGLGGEVRSVSHIEQRVQEAAKLGFRRIVIPQGNLKSVKRNGDIEVVAASDVGNALELLFS
jgi:DNA repair protein RadA/Sms